MSHRHSNRVSREEEHRRHYHRSKERRNREEPTDRQHNNRQNDRQDHNNRQDRQQSNPRQNERQRSPIRIKREPREEGRPRSSNHRRGNRRQRNNATTEEENYEWGRPADEPVKEEDEAPKAKPDFGLSGKLAEDTNTYNGIVIKYNEPMEARKPKRRWRLYPFKGETSLPFIPVHRQSAYLLGRERAVCDIPTDHPSCSKQHAALQFRLVDYERDDGSIGKRIRPYIIDLESANGTFVNNKQIDARRYVELMEQDVVKFGFSTREYVVLHENSKGETDDDDVTAENTPEQQK